MEQVVGAAVLRRVWAPLMWLQQSPTGPVAVQHLPLLATGGSSAATGGPLSSILYPPGLRRALLRALPGDSGNPGASLLGVTSTEGPMDVLESDLAQFDGLAWNRQAEILACLNGLTEQQLILSLRPRFDESYLADPHGVQVMFEFGRCLVRLERHPHQADALLSVLAKQSVNDQVAALSAIQQGSLRLRQLDDLPGADAALALARDRLDDLVVGSEVTHEPIVPLSKEVFSLLESRFFRLLALARVRRRDGPGIAEAMASAIEAADQMTKRSAQNEYLRLLTRENEKILCESSVKAASLQCDGEMLLHWSKRLLSVDPQDPFTWRVIAENAHRCGFHEAAALAVAGVLALGAPGAFRTLTSISPRLVGEPSRRVVDALRDEAQRELLAALHSQLLEFYRVS